MSLVPTVLLVSPPILAAWALENRDAMAGGRGGGSLVSKALVGRRGRARGSSK
jgi:hypothetical protein